MRKILLLSVLSALVLTMPTPAVAGELKLTIQNGLVTLIAQDVPLSTIMAEWARVGQTKIVNGDKIMTLVSLHIVDTPERKALDILLRAASGYMAAERPTPIASASVFDRIMILPTSQAPANSGPVTAPPPIFNPNPRPVTPPVPDMDDEPVVTPGNQPVPGPNQPVMPGQPGAPNAPITAPRPGPLPQPAPQQPVPFGTPKPPGPGGRGGGPGGAPGGGGDRN
ncbi:MAG TPA: hypothetical protein VJ813_05490 [Vicinamibacterales bacterium]|nr:hypothetical protein [Vicinamibacterales bacterium]